MKPSFLTAPFFMISYSDFLFCFLLYFLLSFLMFCYFIFLCVYQNHLTISIWHVSIAFSAFSWLSGVTPAQHFASTMIGTSGRDALTRSALEITQMSVHSPTNVMLSISSSSFIATSSPARSVEPNVSLSIGSVFLRAPSSFLILPAFGVTDAVRYREFFAFLGVEIPGFMGVSGKEYSSVKGSDFFFYMRYDRNSFFCSKCAVDEIILHIDYYQYFLHLLFFLHLCLNLIFAVCHCL